MLEDKKIIEIEYDYLEDHALDFLVRWYTSGKKDFMGLSMVDKKMLKSEVKSLDEAEVAEFSSSSIIENHHKTSLVASNAKLSGNENMRSHGVDLIHIKNNKLIFIEVKGAKDNAKQTKNTLLNNFEDAQDQLLQIYNRYDISRFYKVLYSARNEEYKTQTDIALHQILDYKNGDAKELAFDFDLMAAVVYPKNNFSEKFYEGLKTKQCLIEVNNKPSNFGEKTLEKLSQKLAEKDV